MTDPAPAVPNDLDEDRLPDLMPCLEAHAKWFSGMGKNAFYDALGSVEDGIPAKKFGGRWFVLTRPLLRILDGDHDAA